jgi:hypothetical protein
MNLRTDSGETPDETYPNGYAEVHLAARRLRSTWGLHWRCEEHMLASLERVTSDGISGSFGPFLPLFQVCRQITQTVVCRLVAFTRSRPDRNK